jgi:hypothetical protein
MPDKIYLVKFKRHQFGLQQVKASMVEIYNEHLIFCDSQGHLTGLFPLQIVQSWNEISTSDRPKERFLRVTQ